jgi:hypothetical protein
MLRSAYRLCWIVILMFSNVLQLLGFVSEEGAGKYLYEGDFSLDSIKVKLLQELISAIHSCCFAS